MGGAREGCPWAAADAAAVARIDNAAIAARIATFESEPRTVAERRTWLARHDERHPVVVAVEGGRVLAFASVEAYRDRACYDGVGEFSVYVDPGARGLGLGRLVLEAPIARCAALGYWKVLRRVFVENAAGRALCRAAGVREVGVYAKHARLDGAWRDVVIVERLIEANLGGSPVRSGPAAKAGSGLGGCVRSGAGKRPTGGHRALAGAMSSARRARPRRRPSVASVPGREPPGRAPMPSTGGATPPGRRPGGGPDAPPALPLRLNAPPRKTTGPEDAAALGWRPTAAIGRGGRPPASVTLAWRRTRDISWAQEGTACSAWPMTWR